MFPFKEIEIQLGKYKLYGKLYLKDKKLPTILLLHGLGFHSFEYDSLAPLLVKENFNCLSFDFRCCGKSSGKRGYWTLAEYIEDASIALKYIQENINNKIIIFGNSLGATVAISLAAKNINKQIMGIIASNCATKPIDFNINPIIRVSFGVILLISKIIPFKININHFLPYSKTSSDKKIIENIINDKNIRDARKLAISTYQDILSWDMKKIVPKVKTPILILQGKNDHLQSITQSAKLFSIANEPKKIILMETGHMPNLENPEYLSNILVEWINNLSS